jgi:hypothetical protein
MTANTGWRSAGYPVTIDDLDRMPDHGRRY